MQVKRGRFVRLAGAFAAAAVPRFPAGAAEFTAKLALNTPLTHPLGARAAEACEKILRDSGGRLEIRVYPDSQLGGDTQLLSQVRLGALEFLLIGDNILQNVVPVSGVSAVPFAFASYKEAWNAMDGPLGSYVRGAVAKNANLYAFDKEWDSGMRQMMNNLHPIFTPDDLKGLKIRVPPAPVQMAMYKVFGATPVPLQGHEIYTGLQTHLVDALDHSLSSVEAQKFYEVQKYASMTNHVWTGFSLIAGGDFWRRLPKRLTDVAAQHFNAAAAVERNDIMREDVTLQTTLKGQGMIFNQAVVQTFKAALHGSGLYAQWRDDFGQEAWTLLEKAAGKLA